MNTKDEVLKELEENREKYISGQDLADKLSLSRTAIWKAIKSLKEEGFIIDSQTKKGYRLDANCDKLTEFGVKKDLIPELKDIDIRIYDEIDSTNTEAKRLLYSENIRHFTLLASDYQAAGRGRTGKSFKSYRGTGLYYSIILRPKDNFDFSYFDLITVRSAVSVVKAIKDLTEKDAAIKWVNDIYIDGKKVCGILSELDADFETKTVSSIIIGIGINLKYPDHLDDDLKNIFGALDTNILKNQILAKLVNEFYLNYYKAPTDEILKYYKDHSLVLGKKVTYEINGEKREGLALDVNDKGNLIVERNGEKEILSSGEVSIKGDFLNKN
ncbi:biotin--[acetyl-CoA-carboxylase] ligase [Peptoniphilus raoultii]|uniref:biotin--[acetyl-CoA-carboxylase] ligase n=1 Tax=Peptoniphilus raoultii TaxID=1776387 RepID=UPI0008DA4CF2|nr:biotin--[acetyl-CoA-carboxylase] ligase [Peptoniphilus raoultii]